MRTNLIKQRESLEKAIPFDLQAISSKPNWREKLIWPAAYPDTTRISMMAGERHLQMLREISDPFQRRLAIAALPAILPRALSIVEAAYLTQRANDSGLRIVGGPSELDALRGEITADQLGAMVTPKTPYSPGHIEQMPSPRMAWLRHIKIAAPWNGWRLPKAIISPTATALSVSALLVRGTQMPGERISFQYPKTILSSALRGAKPAAIDHDVRALEDRFVNALSDEPSLSTELRLILADLIRRIVANTLATAGQHLKALEHARDVPERIWSGTSGVYLPRIIGLEVMRRGGDAVRFSHGGCYTFLYDNTLEAATVELPASTHFVAPSGNMAETMKRSGALEKVGAINRPTIHALDGDPQIIQALSSKRQANPQRPRVMYVMTLMMGFRQYLTPSGPADVVFLDWQYRLVEFLKILPIELLCQPHPGGVMPGRSHPITEIAACSSARFEAMMDWPDIFLFDIIGSTTFLKSAITDRKMVLANLVPTPMAPFFTRMLRKRCAMIDIEYDDRRLPRFNSAQLANAVCNLDQIGDPTEFRELYSGGTPIW